MASSGAHAPPQLTRRGLGHHVMSARQSVHTKVTHPVGTGTTQPAGPSSAYTPSLITRCSGSRRSCCRAHVVHESRPRPPGPGASSWPFHWLHSGYYPWKWTWLFVLSGFSHLETHITKPETAFREGNCYWLEQKPAACVSSFSWTTWRKPGPRQKYLRTPLTLNIDMIHLGSCR